MNAIRSVALSLLLNERIPSLSSSSFFLSFFLFLRLLIHEKIKQTSFFPLSRHTGFTFRVPPRHNTAFSSKSSRHVEKTRARIYECAENPFPPLASHQAPSTAKDPGMNSPPCASTFFFAQAPRASARHIPPNFTSNFPDCASTIGGDCLGRSGVTEGVLAHGGRGGVRYRGRICTPEKVTAMILFSLREQQQENHKYTTSRKTSR